MQINGAGLLAAQQAKILNAAQQRPAAKPGVDALFEPLFEKPDIKPAAPAAAQSAPQTVRMARPGSQIDIRV